MGGGLPQLDLRHATLSSGPRFPHLGKGIHPLPHAAAWGLRIGYFWGRAKAAVQATGGQWTLLGRLFTPRSRCRATAASWASREVSGRESPRPGASRDGASRRRSSPGCAGAGSRTSSGEDRASHGPPGRPEQLHEPAATAQCGSQTHSPPAALFYALEPGAKPRALPGGSSGNSRACGHSHHSGLLTAGRALGTGEGVLGASGAHPALLRVPEPGSRSLWPPPASLAILNPCPPAPPYVPNTSTGTSLTSVEGAPCAVPLPSLPPGCPLPSFEIQCTSSKQPSRISGLGSVLSWEFPESPLQLFSPGM